MIAKAAEVKYTYDGWGNVEKFEQDKNSAVGASGSVDDYEVSYAYAKQTTGRNTIRRTSMTLPSGKVISYTYLTRNGIYDNPSSRVTEIKGKRPTIPGVIHRPRLAGNEDSARSWALSFRVRPAAVSSSPLAPPSTTTE